MGLVCEIFLAGALSASYNINSGATPQAGRVCRGIALTEAAEGSVGKKLAFRLSADDVAVPGQSGSLERLPDGNNNQLLIRRTAADGTSTEMPLNPQAVPELRKQVMQDSTPNTAPGMGR